MSDAGQSWFWTEEWQRGEREATEQAEAGLGTTYENTDAFLASLDD